MKHLYFSIILLLCASINVNAQRFLSEVFTDVTVTDNIVFSNNITVISGSPAPEDLEMTIYEPTGDTMSKRPVFVYLHTGNFLPKPLNGGVVGNRNDSAIVEICTRLAKYGYVVASIDYRLGWNPLGQNQDERTGTLLNAVYRAVQDGRTAVRFLRKDAATTNTYKIEPGRISVLGEGSGGYVAFAMASLNKLSEIQMTKFFDLTSNQFYVDTALSGDWNGIGGNGLNITNHAGYNSEISFSCNLGGAMGDSTWLEAGDVPMVSFHCPNDPFAPYMYGTVIVPTTQQTVVDVSGSHDIQRQTNGFGNNDPFISQNISDAWTTRANAINDGHKGLFPFIRPSPESAPWQWWDPNEPNDSTAKLTNPDMSKAKALAYIDTIMGYLAPRVYHSVIQAPPLTVEEAEVRGVSSVFPNPTADVLNIAAEEQIRQYTILNNAGQIVRTAGVNSNFLNVSVEDFAPGLYFIQVETSAKTDFHKVIIK
ncbi:MAG: T9SS type A sorting domain-containing protein [Flavobacteriales bacterium]|nr:T9SS type A sorting domain-containing protein [Flavobacteriales bacterium]